MPQLAIHEKLTTEHLTQLYRTFLKDLERVRREQKELYRKRVISDLELNPVTGKLLRGLAKFGILPSKPPRMRPQFDDLDAELTYLLLRETRPEVVVEISPCDGWSTNWILRALRDNGTGFLHSFDIHDRCTQNVGTDLSTGRWKFHLGDVTKPAAGIPGSIDYLFMDSDHSAEFGRWYLESVVPRVAPGAIISVDDVFHFADPGQFDGEGRVVIDWLEQQGIPWITLAPARDPGRYAELMALRESLGIARRIHTSQRNTAVFFVKPGG